MTLWSRNTLSRFRVDLLTDAVCRLGLGLAVLVMLAIVIFLLRESLPAMAEIGITRFFTDPGWNPLSNQFSLLPMIIGTSIITVFATLVAGPLGVASALLNVYYAPPRMAWLHRRLIELLAGIPSVVFGLWGLTVLAPLLAFGGSGQHLLTAALVVALMILPTVALTSQAALRKVQPELIMGGAALGLDKWTIIRRISLPAAKQGIVVGLVLAVTRALGETMAVLMLAGNVARIPGSPIDPARTLTANIALEMAYATSEHRSVLFVSGLTLFAVSILFVLLAEWLGRQKHA